MSDRINCRNCVHFNNLEHRCCLNDGNEIKKECYFTLPKRKPKGKDIVIENLKTKIADLEAKLAESKNQIRGFQKSIEKRDKQIEGLNKGLSKTQKQSYKIKQSKSQDIITIANQTEKERDLLQQIEKVKEQSICYQAQIYDLKEQLAKEQKHISRLKNMNKSHDESVGRLTEENNQLRQQLAEKEEIIDWQNEIVEGVKQEEELLAQELKSLGADCIEDLGKYHNEDKISFAIEKLEEVDKFVKSGYCFDLGDVRNEIDNQIKQLKEGK